MLQLHLKCLMQLVWFVSHTPVNINQKRFNNNDDYKSSHNYFTQSRLVLNGFQHLSHKRLVFWNRRVTWFIKVWSNYKVAILISQIANSCSFWAFSRTMSYATNSTTARYLQGDGRQNFEIAMLKRYKTVKMFCAYNLSTSTLAPNIITSKLDLWLQCSFNIPIW